MSDFPLQKNQQLIIPYKSLSMYVITEKLRMWYITGIDRITELFHSRTRNIVNETNPKMFLSDLSIAVKILT